MSSSTNIVGNNCCFSMPLLHGQATFTISLLLCRRPCRVRTLGIHFCNFRKQLNCEMIFHLVSLPILLAPGSFGLVFSVSSNQLQRGWSACRIAIKMHILIYLVVVGIVKGNLRNFTIQISALMLKRNEWVKQFTCSYLGLCCIYPIPFNSFKKHCIHINVDRLCLVGSYLFVGCCLFD